MTHIRSHCFLRSTLVVLDVLRNKGDDTLSGTVCALDLSPNALRHTLKTQLGPRGSAVERQSLASVLSPSCTRPVADG